MMLFFHSMFSHELLALAAGVALLMFVKSQIKIKSIWPAIAAWFVIILSVLSIFCTAYTGVDFWYRGYFHQAHMKMMEEMKGEKSKEMPSQMMEKQKNLKDQKMEKPQTFHSSRKEIPGKI